MKLCSPTINVCISTVHCLQLTNPRSNNEPIINKSSYVILVSPNTLFSVPGCHPGFHAALSLTSQLPLGWHLLRPAIEGSEAAGQVQLSMSDVFLMIRLSLGADLQHFLLMKKA
jgi:hypothetical protein